MRAIRLRRALASKHVHHWAIALYDANTQHLIIGLTRAEVDALVRGDVLTLPHNIKPELTANSDIVVALFAETDAELAGWFPPALLPV